MFEKFRTEVLPKLKREWKTAALGAAGLIVEGYDGLVASGQIDLPSLVDRDHHPWVGAGVLTGMFLLRKWKENAGPNLDKPDGLPDR